MSTSTSSASTTSRSQSSAQESTEPKWVSVESGSHTAQPQQKLVVSGAAQVTVNEGTGDVKIEAWDACTITALDPTTVITVMSERVTVSGCGKVRSITSPKRPQH